MKEKEREDRRKAALAQAAHEARLSKIAIAEAAQQTQKPIKDVKTSATPQVMPKTQQGSSSTLEGQQNETPTTTDLVTFSGSPTTNLQIKIQPEKQPEVVCKNESSTLLPTPSNQGDSKVGNPATSSTTSTTDAAAVTTSRPYSAKTLSIPSKTQVKPTTFLSHVPAKPSTSCKSNTTSPSIVPAVGLKQTCSLGNTRSDTEESTSILPTTKPTISSDTSDKDPGNAPANVPTIESKNSDTSEMDVSV